MAKTFLFLCCTCFSILCLLSFYATETGAGPNKTNPTKVTPICEKRLYKVCILNDCLNLSLPFLLTLQHCIKAHTAHKLD